MDPLAAFEELWIGVGHESRFFNLGWAARSSIFWGLKFKVPETLTWHFTDDLSNFALVFLMFVELAVALDELAAFFYLELLLCSHRVLCRFDLA